MTKDEFIKAIDTVLDELNASNQWNYDIIENKIVAGITEFATKLKEELLKC